MISKETMKKIEMKKIEMRQLEKKLEKLSQKEQPKNLCPNCNIFCEARFIDGICR